ncbi:MAG: DUF3343 domain-containing protein [Oscillospiraceae bacterium]|nr:DUF3343 domain-containing protein [Oscillospiraceae bacterium]
MRSFYITFRSVTFAQRGERVLSGGRIRCQLMRTPRWMEEQGCGYALRVWTEDISGAVRLLRGSQIPLRRVYLQHGDGGMEELAL